MKFIPPGASLPQGTLSWPNTDDVQALAEGREGGLHGVPAIALSFPKWTDGRAYSQAVLLRQRLGFAGELLATGDVLVDMLPLLQRCGFSAVQLRADQQQAHAERALGFFASGPGGVPLHYQGQQVPGGASPLR